MRITTRDHCSGRTLDGRQVSVMAGRDVSVDEKDDPNMAALYQSWVDRGAATTRGAETEELLVDDSGAASALPGPLPGEPAQVASAALPGPRPGEPARFNSAAAAPPPPGAPAPVPPLVATEAEKQEAREDDERDRINPEQNEPVSTRPPAKAASTKRSGR